MGTSSLLLVAACATLISSGCAMTMLPSATPVATHTLGAPLLQQVVIDAAQQDESESVDLDGILWLEHINLVVGNKALAENFYIDFLGLTRDPDAKFHCNLGQQQFHLAETGDPAQRIVGSVGLVVPSLRILRGRLASAQKNLEGTSFDVVEDSDLYMTVRCPWGNIFHLYDIEREIQEPIDSDQKMVKLHAQGGTYAATRMSIRGKPGIRFMEIACSVGSVSSIAQFYREMLNCAVQTTTEPNRATACVGPGVHLIFVETPGLHEEEHEQMKGVHICIYVAPRFRDLYTRLAKHNLIWSNPRFLHLDSCDTWEAAQSSRTLRFKDIVDLSTAAKVLELEHETRPTRHGQFMKPLHYLVKE